MQRGTYYIGNTPVFQDVPLTRQDFRTWNTLPQVELVRSSLVSGHVGYDYSNPYLMELARQPTAKDIVSLLPRTVPDNVADMQTNIVTKRFWE